MPDINIRQLHQSDATMLEKLLRPATEHTLFLRYNHLRGGLNYEGKPGQGIFWGAFCGARLTSVISLAWNGHLQLFAPACLHELCNELLQFLGNSDRTLSGLNGAPAYVRAAVDYLNLYEIEKNLDNEEKLYALSLNDLVFPQIKNISKARLRTVEENDFETLARWHTGYAVEALGQTDDANLRATAQKRIKNLIRIKPEHIWLLDIDGTPVCRTNFSAAVPDAVMVAGVWTPPEYRNRGYARLAVALSLIEAREAGVEMAYLFANSLPATRAYESIGFREIGEYALMLFTEPWSPLKTD